MVAESTAEDAAWKAAPAPEIFQKAEPPAFALGSGTMGEEESPRGIDFDLRASSLPNIDAAPPQIQQAGPDHQDDGNNVGE